MSWAATAVLILAIAVTPILAETRSLSITADSTDDRPLPADAILEVDLFDVSRADAPSVRLASQRFKISGWPATLRIAYDDAAIDLRMTYVVAARVVSGDEVLLRTTTAYPVLTRGGSQAVSIVLDRSGGAASAGRSIAGVAWTASEIGGRALIASNPPTITFRSDGTFALFGGCNHYRGNADIANRRIAFAEPFAGTRKACPPARTKLERDVLAALGKAGRYQFDRPVLNLMNDAGIVVLRFREDS